MAEYVVDTSSSAEITIGATGTAEILQNVRMILSTIRGTVPLDRTFGLSITFLDRPMPAAMAEYRGEVVEAVQRLEPRVTVTSVDFTEDTDGAMDGILYPVVTIDIEE